MNFFPEKYVPLIAAYDAPQPKEINVYRKPKITASPTQKTNELQSVLLITKKVLTKYPHIGNLEAGLPQVSFVPLRYPASLPWTTGIPRRTKNNFGMTSLRFMPEHKFVSTQRDLLEIMEGQKQCGMYAPAQIVGPINPVIELEDGTIFAYLYDRKDENYELAMNKAKASLGVHWITVASTLQVVKDAKEFIPTRKRVAAKDSGLGFNTCQFLVISGREDYVISAGGNVYAGANNVHA